MEISATPQAPNFVLTGHFSPAEAQRYRHVPFEVPQGVRQLHLEYTYSDRIPSDPTLSGGNTLDIGLFDQQGTAAGGPGFRGWSGSNKLEFTIDGGWATPPYRPGRPDAGTWTVLLGPYKVGPRGLDYEVRIWFNLGLAQDFVPPAMPDQTTPAPLPAALEPGWLRGDLHSHTVRSDGDSWPVETMSMAATLGLDYLGITDHNSATPLAGADLPSRPLLVPGVEVTTYGGHWNVWGFDGWLEFREPTSAATAAAMQIAREAGGFISVNHPKPFGPPWEYGDVRGYHAIEVWNGPWDHLNPISLTYWEAHLQRGERIVAVGGSDTHHLKRPDTGPLRLPHLGNPTTWIQLASEQRPSVAGLLAGLFAGRCFVSVGPEGPQLLLHSAPNGVEIRVAGAEQMVLLLLSDTGYVAAAAITGPDWHQTFDFPRAARYLRAQVADPTGRLVAVSNPVWRDTI